MITITNGEIRTNTPYDVGFVMRARQLGGKWNSDDRTWTFATHLETEVKAALKTHYGWSENAKTVTLIVTAKKTVYEDVAPVKFGPYVLARAWGRDSGAKPGGHVALLSGRVTSGGSRKNWTSKVIEGAQFKIVAPADIAERLVSTDEFDVVREDTDGAEKEAVAVGKLSARAQRALVEMKKGATWSRKGKGHVLKTAWLMKDGKKITGFGLKTFAELQSAEYA